MPLIYLFSHTIKGIKHFIVLSLLYAMFPLMVIGQANSLNFDGIDDYVNLNSLAIPLENSTEFTVEFWMKAKTQSQTSSIRTILFAINKSTASGNGLLIVVGGNFQQDGKLMIYDDDSGGNFSQFISDQPIADDVCHHIAYVRSGFIAKTFIDGIKVSEHTSNLKLSASDLYSLGQEWDYTGTSNPIASQFYNGDIDEFRIWNYARSDDEIQLNTNKTLNGTEAGLLAYYNFDQGLANHNNTSETILNDKSTPSYNGTLQNFSLDRDKSNWTEAKCLTCDPITVYDTTDICIGTTVYYPDNSIETISESLTKEFLFTNQNGCDSVISLTIHALPTFDTTVVYTLCEDEVFSFPDGVNKRVNADTSFSLSLSTESGCDSIVSFKILTLKKHETYSSEFICQGSQYTFQDGSVVVLEKDTLITNLFTTTNGCDSNFYHLIQINKTDTGIENLELCLGEKFTLPNGSEVTLDSTIVFTSNSTTPFGCDSITKTTITALPLYYRDTTFKVCSGSIFEFPNANQVQIIRDTTFYNELTSSKGCDSIISGTIIVLPNFFKETREKVCSGTQFQFPDGSLLHVKSDTLQTSILQSEHGCDSIISTQLKVTETNRKVEEYTICERSNFTFPDGSILVNISKDTTYVSQFTNSKGCDSIISTFLTVKPVPKSILGNDTSICINESLLLKQMDGFDYYLWNTGSMTYSTLISNTGLYTVIAGNKCGEISDSIYVESVSCECYTYVPNAFTPNREEPNELFFPVFTCPLKKYHLQIFNRWGQIIFESQDVNQKWDGTSKGKSIPIGTYPYLLNYETEFDHPKQISGHINLIR